MPTEPGSRRSLRHLAASAVAGCLFVTAALICPDSVAAGRSSARSSDAAHAKQRHTSGSAQRHAEQPKSASGSSQSRRKAVKTRSDSRLVVQQRAGQASRSAWVGQRSAVRAPALNHRGVAHGARTAVAQGAEAERLASHIARKWRMPLPRAQRIVRAAYEQARERDLSATLILAVVAQESSFRAAARSHRGAQGLMQVIPRYHPEKLKGLPRDALLEPETNIQVGSQVLAEYIERVEGRVDPALIMYSGKARAYPQKVRAVWTQLERVRSAEEEDI